MLSKKQLRDAHIAIAVGAVIIFGGGFLVRNADEAVVQVVGMTGFFAMFAVLAFLADREIRRQEREERDQ